MVLAALVRSVMLGSWDNVFICLLVLALFLLPSIVQKNLRITFPTGMQIVILIHIFATEFLGEIACYYVQYPHWDSIVHTVWGFLCAAIGYLLVDLLNRDMPKRFHLSPAYLAVAAFCFSMTIGVLWEFFEFAMDRLFLMDMQKDTIIPQFASTLLDETHRNIPVAVSGIDSVTVNGQVLVSGGYLDIGLYDTMEDLFVNFLGALTFALIGYFSSRRERAKRIAEQFIPHVTQPLEPEASNMIE